MRERINILNDCAVNVFGKIPNFILPLLARFSIAGIFWRSAMTKISLNEEASNFSFSQIMDVITLDWQVGDITYILFENEYDLPFISPEFGAHMAIAAEIVLPLMLVIGMGTRFASLGLLGMVIVIQTFVLPHAWPDHMVWAVALLYLIKNGAGWFSLDHKINRYC